MPPAPMVRWQKLGWFNRRPTPLFRKLYPLQLTTTHKFVGICNKEFSLLSAPSYLLKQASFSNLAMRPWVNTGDGLIFFVERLKWTQVHREASTRRFSVMVSRARMYLKTSKRRGRRKKDFSPTGTPGKFLLTITNVWSATIISVYELCAGRWT